MFNKFVRNLFIISSLFPIFFIRGIVSAFIFKESGWWLYFIFSVIFFVIAFAIIKIATKKLELFFHNKGGDESISDNTNRNENNSICINKTKSIILFCLILATSLLPSNILFFVGYCIIYLFFIFRNPLNPIFWILGFRFYQLQIGEKFYFLVSKYNLKQGNKNKLKIIAINERLLFNPPF